MCVRLVGESGKEVYKIGNEGALQPGVPKIITYRIYLRKGDFSTTVAI